MGILGNLFGKKKPETESGANTPMPSMYADELRQIQEDYVQGFLTQEEYDFQMGMYKKWSNMESPNTRLHVVEKDTTGDVELFKISIRVGKFITKKFTVNEELDSDFCWLRDAATPPYLHHLCFTYKKTVYSCLIGIVKDNGEIWVRPKEAEHYFIETLNRCLYPCIIPVTGEGDIYDIHSPVLDANTLQPINFDEQDDFVPPIMTEYELYARGVISVAGYLKHRGCTNIAISDVVGITPSIWFDDENGKRSYVFVRSLPAGLDKMHYDFNKDVVSLYKENKGYFVNLLWNNLLGNNGNFRDTRIYKNGSYVHNKIELEPLSPLGLFEADHPYINFYSNIVSDDDHIWDASLEMISEQEQIRYKIYSYHEELKPGDNFDVEDVFGKGKVSAEEFIEFQKVMARLSEPTPVLYTPEDLQAAVLKVKSEDAEMMYRIANTYLGLLDYNEAVKWYRKAADLGNSDAMCRLAGAYAYGDGIDPDREKSLQLTKKAIVTDGNSDALLDLGLCYLKGEGVPKNEEHGVFLMKRSAKQGNMAAQYNMGVIYRKGIIVEANMEEALRWYRLSAAKGYEQAVDYLNQYENLN